MTFRTPKEAVELANNTPYGLAASVWTENINLALDVAPKLKAGVVWVNCTNMFDAASGFGGYRESGFGREGGREGMFEYLKADYETRNAEVGMRNDPIGVEKPNESIPHSAIRIPQSDLPPLDRTYKLFIGGKQARPDQGYSRKIVGADGRMLGEVGEGNRKDIRNAVEAAHAAEGWGRATGHARAQILYYIAENLATRADEYANRIAALTGDDVDGIWYCGGAAGAKAVEFASAANMKRTWVMTRPRDWLDPRQGEGREFLRHASEVKNIWIPYGE